MRRQSPAARILPALILGLVLGLLGMHTFSADAMGHGPSPHHAVSAPTASDAAAAHVSADHDEASAAASLHAPPHAALTMTCVLALVAGLVFVVRPSGSVTVGPRLQQVPSARASDSRRAPARPPSHIVLCISRT